MSSPELCDVLGAIAGEIRLDVDELRGANAGSKELQGGQDTGTAPVAVDPRVDGQHVQMEECGANERVVARRLEPIAKRSHQVGDLAGVAPVRLADVHRSVAIAALSIVRQPVQDLPIDRDEQHVRPSEVRCQREAGRDRQGLVVVGHFLASMRRRIHRLALDHSINLSDRERVPLDPGGGAYGGASEVTLELDVPRAELLLRRAPGWRPTDAVARPFRGRSCARGAASRAAADP